MSSVQSFALLHLPLQEGLRVFSGYLLDVRVFFLFVFQRDTGLPEKPHFLMCPRLPLGQPPLAGFLDGAVFLKMARISAVIAGDCKTALGTVIEGVAHLLAIDTVRPLSFIWSPGAVVRGVPGFKTEGTISGAARPP